MNPPCEKCAFFIPGKYPHTGSCKKFTAIRGRLRAIHDFTENVRLDPKRCGPKGRYYIKKEGPLTDQ